MSYPPPGGFTPYPNSGYPAPGPGEGANYSINPFGPNPTQQPNMYPNMPGGAYPTPYPGGAPYPTPGGGQPQGGYPPSQGGYPPVQGGYPPAPAGYPPAQGGYPPAQGGYPPAQGGYPPAQGGYPSAQGAYPPAQGGYPPAQGGYPSAQGAYPPAQGGGSSYPPMESSSPYPPAGNPSQGQAGPMAGEIRSSTISQQSSAAYPRVGSSAAAPVSHVRPTVRASMSFDPSTDAATLRKAMKGFGTDEKAITQVLGRRTSQQRQEIMLKYQQSYGKLEDDKLPGDLIKDLKSELSGNFEDVIMALMTPLPAFLASEIKKSISGIGTKESVLIEILCCNDNNLLRAVKTSYTQQYHVALEKDIASDTSGNFKRLLLSVSTAQRDEHLYDPSLAASLAQSLYKAGEGRMGTNNEEFNRIMASYSHQQLKLVFDEYHKIKGRSFEAAIKSELSGDFEDGMVAIYHSCMNRCGYFAKRLKAAMDGAGTKDEALIRLIVSRSEIDLGTIKEEYTKLYNKSLETVVSSETSGDYKKVLLALLQD